MLISPEPVVYACAGCTTRARVPAADTRVPMHNCPGRALMAIPLIREGERVDVRLIPREDYVGREDVRYAADGAVFMRCEVERADQTDVWVYAPTAHASASGPRSD
jgi:hypothetical protein